MSAGSGCQMDNLMCEESIKKPAGCNGNCQQGRVCDCQPIRCAHDDKVCERVEDCSRAGCVRRPGYSPSPIERAMSALAVQEGGDHYKGMAIQPAEYVHSNRIPYLEGSVIYYVSRWRSKGGIADLKKARHTLDLLMELEERKPKGAAWDTQTR